MNYKETNSACLKRMLLLMDKETFVNHAREINKIYVDLEPTPKNQNFESKIYGLLRFCVVHYNRHFLKNKKF